VTIRLDRRTVLAGALACFVLANLVGVLTEGFAGFLAARTAAGAFQGVFVAAAFEVGAAVVPARGMGHAIVRSPPAPPRCPRRQSRT
jgi:DHA1 family inner membrane transport protein